jgi:hypothetical protein
MAIHSSAPLRGWLAAVLATPFLLLTLMSATTAASAQTIGTDPRNKRCQTLLTCNYARGGLYRGCLSSYTCRVCRPERVRCSASDIASGRRQCTELVCSWGG